VSKELFQEDAEARRFALMGYSDAEGCCNMRTNRAHRRIKWSSVNKVGLLQVRNLLHDFDIQTSKLTSSYGNGGKFKSFYPCWDLTIENCISLARFYRLVGFGMRSKQAKLLNMLLFYKQNKEINTVNKELFGSPVVQRSNIRAFGARDGGRKNPAEFERRVADRNSAPGYHL